MRARDSLAVAAGAHDEDLATRADVVARLELGRCLQAELEREHLGIGMDRVAAAHGAEVTMPIG